MTTYSRGDIAIFSLTYTDGSGRRKNRPVYILSTEEFHRARRKAIIGAITTNLSHELLGDWIIGNWQAAGLRAPSKALPVLETVELVFLGPVIGQLSPEDVRGFEGVLKRVLGF